MMGVQVFVVAVLAGLLGLSYSMSIEFNVDDIDLSPCGKGCAPVKYPQIPWHAKIPGELVVQPTCSLELGDSPIAPYDLRLTVIFNHPIDDLKQWTFKKMSPWTFTNKDTFYPSDNTEWSFQVFYNGTEEWWPKFIATAPPRGFCLYRKF